MTSPLDLSHPRIPIEIAHVIFTLIPIKESVALPLVSRGWESVYSSESFWASKCLGYKWVKRLPQGITWKQLFRERYPLHEHAVSQRLVKEAHHSKLLSWSSDTLEITYIGARRTPKSCQASKPMRPLPFGKVASIGYYEIYVINVGDKPSVVTMGAAINSFSKNNAIPGWLKFSYGYHGDDGGIYFENGFTYIKEEKWGLGDTIGCGFDFQTNNIFFTKNGKLIHSRLVYEIEIIKGQLLPTIGMRSKNACCSVNFGQEPFKFDVIAYISKQCINYQEKMLIVPKYNNVKADWEIIKKTYVCWEWLDAELNALGQSVFLENKALIDYFKRLLTRVGLDMHLASETELPKVLVGFLEHIVPSRLEQHIREWCNVEDPGIHHDKEAAYKVWLANMLKPEFTWETGHTAETKAYLLDNNVYYPGDSESVKTEKTKAYFIAALGKYRKKLAIMSLSVLNNLQEIHFYIRHAIIKHVVDSAGCYDEKKTWEEMCHDTKLYYENELCHDNVET